MYIRENKKVTIKFMTAAILFVSIILFSSLFPELVKADTASISVKEINYEESTITLLANAGDTEVYFSDSQKKTWEKIPGEIGSDLTITLDISWVSTSKNYVMTFKGDSSTSITSVTIPKQVTNFKVTYSKMLNKVSFSNAGTRTIEWRKKGSSSWNTVNSTTISSELSYLYNNGATLYFRLAPVNGTSGTATGYRASKEVTLTIPKKIAAPKITIDGSSFSIYVKKGMAYRTVNSDSTTTDWTTVSASTDLLLKNVAEKALYTNASTAQSEVTLQFRTNATTSSQVSKITTVTVPVQEGPPDKTTYGMTITYTSSSTVSLQVKAASSSVPFEYTIVEAGEELNIQTATWKVINSSAAVALSKTSAPQGSHIYVRKQSIEETDTVDFALASVETEVTEASGLEYPDAPVVNTLTTLITTAGVCRATDSSSYLSFSLYSSTSTTVSSITFLDGYGISKGTVSCKSTVAKNSSSTTDDTKYIITTKITSTSNLDSVTEELLFAKITLANSDVITSSDTKGVRLYLYPGTTVNNPEDDDDYTNSFSRVYLSTDTNDESSFKFQLDFGKAKIMDATTLNTETSTAVAISSLKLDGYTLTNGTDYSVVYGSYVNTDDETITTATVTVNVKNFEASSLIDETNAALPLIVTLNNGEVLSDDVTITLINTATLDSIPIAWSITEGSLKETKTSTITNSDDTTTTVIEEVITYTLTLTLYDKNYSVGIADVTWGGTSILGSTKIADGKATIYLSNAKINKLTTTSTDTKNVIITLSNGFTISNGCKLTILNATQ